MVWPRSVARESVETNEASCIALASHDSGCIPGLYRRPPHHTTYSGKLLYRLSGWKHLSPTRLSQVTIVTLDSQLMYQTRRSLPEVDSVSPTCVLRRTPLRCGVTTIFAEISKAL